MIAWAELERLLQKATTLVDLRRCHEEYVSIAYHCCFLDTPAVERWTCTADSLGYICRFCSSLEVDNIPAWFGATNARKSFSGDSPARTM
uniref:Uncharacterized protein n=1 Tax=Hyaloperonospora arabidopsidis (strain Emoy2) TaxID=559515 RepID=M4BL23_HYAAE